MNTRVAKRLRKSLVLETLCMLNNIPILNILIRRLLLIRLQPKLKNVHIAPGFKCFEGNIHGNNVSLANTFFIDHGDIFIGEGTGFSYNNIVITSTHNIDDYPTNFGEVILKDIHIGENCWITTNVTILPGVTIGDNVIIGAGSVVVSDIPSNCFATGNPCKVKYYLNGGNTLG